MKLFSSEEARQIDQYTMTELGISGEKLMGAAGLSVANRAQKMLLSQKGKKVIIICGKGNNGGDGYAAAVNLSKFGANVFLVSIVEKNLITGDAKIFHDKCSRYGLNIQYLQNPKDVNWGEFDLIIDGLLGTGIKGTVRQNIAIWIDYINNSNKPILAIDIPSGINSDNGQILGTGVKATATVTMGFMKQGLVINPGREYSGEVEVAHIGYPKQSFKLIISKKRGTDVSIVEKYLSKPPSTTYKHKQGKIFILGGSIGFTGAACLTARAALRVGAGLVITGVPESLNPIYETKLTEIITSPLPDSGDGHFHPNAVDYLQSKLDWCHVLAIGPGLGTDENSLQFAKEVITRCEKPMVIDADALRLFHHHLSLFKSLEDRFIITPHYGEAAALTQIDKQSIINDPFRFLLNLSQEIGGVIVLKGAPTLIGFHDQIVVNMTGHQGLATGGSGDVLTGVIAGFLAQGMPSEVAAEVGVYIHGKAADSLLPSHGYRGLIASDLLKVLPGLIRKYECE